MRTGRNFRLGLFLIALLLNICASRAEVDQRQVQVIAEGDFGWNTLACPGNLTTSASYSANSALAVSLPVGSSASQIYFNEGGFFIRRDVRRTIFHDDFDGDGRTDAWTYDEQNGVWYFILSSSPNVLLSMNFGGPGALACPEDYDGDGKYDPCIYWQSEGMWQMALSDSGYASSTYFVPQRGLPSAGDYDGDGYADIAVFVPQTQRWMVFFSKQLYTVTTFTFGEANAIPVVADFDGDRLTDPAVYQEKTGHWIVALSASQYRSASFFLGGSGYLPVQGDYDGDLNADPVVYGLDDGLWQGYLSAGGYQRVSAKFGMPGATPYTGDYDNDGISDLSFMTADQSALYLFKSTEGFDVIPPK